MNSGKIYGLSPGWYAGACAVVALSCLAAAVVGLIAVPYSTRSFSSQPTIAGSTSAASPIASPTSILPSGKIVFTCRVYQAPNGDQVCIMDADGSHWRKLTDNFFENYYPALGPDGNSLVFASSQSGAFEVYEMDVNGKQKQLTFGIGEAAAPEISPDGTKIVFANNIHQFDRIWIMNRNGSNPHQIYFDPNADSLDPSWSPDGTKILFAHGNGDNKQLEIMNADGTGLRPIKNSFSTRGRSEWSPDGNLIAGYSGQGWDRGIYLMSADGSNLHPLPVGGTALAPSFSPDSQWIVFTGYLDHPQDDNGCEIYIIRIDGRDLRRITNNDYCDWQPRWGR